MVFISCCLYLLTYFSYFIMVQIGKDGEAVLQRVTAVWRG